MAVADARRHLPDVVRKRGGDYAAVAAALDMLDAVVRNVDEIEAEAYEAHRAAALARIEKRDPNDWPILASSVIVWQRCGKKSRYGPRASRVADHAAKTHLGRSVNDPVWAGVRGEYCSIAGSDVTLLVGRGISG